MEFITDNFNIISILVDIIGIIIIVISVLYLAKQTSQTNKIAQGDSEREMFDSFNELISRYASYESIELIQTALTDFNTLSNREKARFCLIYGIPHINYLDQSWGLYKKKLISQEQFKTVSNIVIAILKTNGGKQMWKELQYSYRPSFVKFVDSQLSKSDKVVPITDIVSGFNIEENGIVQ